ncbi:hypothetical protein D3C85_1197580 [compost metagenome]
MHAVAAGAEGLEGHLALLLQRRIDRLAMRQQLLPSEVDGHVDPIFQAQVRRQLGHHVILALAAGELLEGGEQIHRVLLGQVGNVRSLAVAVLAVAIGAEADALLTGGIGLFTQHGVGVEPGKALHGFIAGLGQAGDATEEHEGECAHGGKPLPGYLERTGNQGADYRRNDSSVPRRRSSKWQIAGYRHPLQRV